MNDETRWGRWIFGTVALAICVLITSMIAYPAYNRYQNIQNAQNKVHVTEIEISNTQQLIDVEKKKAEIRVAEAEGIAQAQKIINTTLTDKYLMHEAIKAQEKMAGSPSHTQIYIPVGQGGIPIVKTIDVDAKEGK